MKFGKLEALKEHLENFSFGSEVNKRVSKVYRPERTADFLVVVLKSGQTCGENISELNDLIDRRKIEYIIDTRHEGSNLAVTFSKKGTD